MIRREPRNLVDISQLDISRCELETHSTLEKFVRDHNIVINQSFMRRNTLPWLTDRKISKQDLCKIIREWHADQMRDRNTRSRVRARVVVNPGRNIRTRRPNNQSNNSSSQSANRSDEDDSPIYPQASRSQILRSMDLATGQSDVVVPPSLSVISPEPAVARQAAALRITIPDCCVCYEYLDLTEHKPMILSCGHGICLVCTNSLVPHQSNNRSINRSINDYNVLCPQCRQPSARSAAAVNYPLLNLVETLINMLSVSQPETTSSSGPVSDQI